MYVYTHTQSTAYEFKRPLDIILLEYLLQEARTFTYICLIRKFKDCPTNMTIYIYIHDYILFFRSHRFL